ncbi:MAG: hypothetical protein U1E17_04285 [Geminicoccaceae bacterium]
MWEVFQVPSCMAACSASFGAVQEGLVALVDRGRGRVEGGDVDRKHQAREALAILLGGLVVEEVRVDQAVVERQDRRVVVGKLTMSVLVVDLRWPPAACPGPRRDACQRGPPRP